MAAGQLSGPLRRSGPSSCAVQEGAEADRAFRRDFAEAGALLPALMALYRRRARAGPATGQPATDGARPATDGALPVTRGSNRGGSSSGSARVLTPEGEGAEQSLPAGSRPEGCSDAWWAALLEVGWHPPAAAKFDRACPAAAVCTAARDASTQESSAAQ